jgi:hypothetical protein
MKTKAILPFLCLSVSAQVLTIDNFNSGDFTRTTAGETATSGQGMIGTRRVQTQQDGMASVASGVLTFTKPGTSLSMWRMTDFLVDARPYQYVSVTMSELTAPVSFIIGFGQDNLPDNSFAIARFNFTEPGTIDALIERNFDMSAVNLAVFSFQQAGEYEFDNIGFAAVPEPSTYAACFGIGLAGFAGWRRWRR